MGDRRLSLEPGTAMPAQLEVVWILFAACPAEHDPSVHRRFFESPDNLLASFEVTVANHPYFRIGMGKRNIPEAALGVLVEQPGGDVGVPEKIEHDMGFHEVRCST